MSQEHDGYECREQGRYFQIDQDSINVIAVDPKIGLRGKRGENYYELLVKL